jgi:hypothetical protein
MILFALAVALGCLFASITLAIGALYLLWKRCGWLIARTPWGKQSHAGVLHAEGETVTAPFSGQPVLWVRARVLGPSPNDPTIHVLWSKELVATAVLRTAKSRAIVPLREARILSTVRYRRGVEKVLEREAPLLSRVLSRAGWKTRPPGNTFFELEEEYLSVGQRVFVHGKMVDQQVVPASEDEPVVVAALEPQRVLLREGWGPLLALWFATLSAISGGTVLVAAWWLRRTG